MSGVGRKTIGEQIGMRDGYYWVWRFDELKGEGSKRSTDRTGEMEDGRESGLGVLVLVPVWMET